jgi:prevent-host-death family protein
LLGDSRLLPLVSDIEGPPLLRPVITVRPVRLVANMTKMVMFARMVLMKKVNIGVLKAQLSEHLQWVRTGEEVLVCDRNKPVARIIPYSPRDHDDQIERLVARGALVPPRRKSSGDLSWPLPPGNVSDEAMKQVWQQEREGR